MPADTFTTLLSHFTSWNDLAGKPAVVTYSFAADGPAGFAPFSAQQQASARSALAAWDRISGLSFVELPDTPGGAGIDLRFRLEAMNSVAILGQAELPPDGDVALNIALFRTDSLAPSATRIGYQTLLHEIGHGLGLAHPDATIPGAAQNTLMVATLGQTQPVNAPLAWDRAAIQSLYGTQEAETLRWSWDASLGAVRGEGTPGDDVMTGTAHRDALFGGAGTDMLRGAAGNDLLTPGLGDDVVEGGAGFDTLALGVTRAAMAFNPAGAVESAEGRDRFSDIEALRSLDGTTYLQAPDGLASLVGLYAAALGRAPDPGGLAFWWHTMQGGASLGSIAQGFLDSAEFQAGPGLGARFQLRGETPPALLDADALVGLASRADTTALFAQGLWLPDVEGLLVAQLYAVCLGRNPDPTGYQSWMADCDAGLSDIALSAGFLYSAEAALHGPSPWASPEALLAEARAGMWAHHGEGVVFA
ncbi:DUF4214 domain-containing protein [Rhodovarius sp.]|uniref:DUF4214 domain-containing protein n=1 Tax=Rhodovarius sp. TaxID=2972673 RepID=UPI0034A19FAA